MANLFSMNTDIMYRLFAGRALEGRLVCKKLCANLSQNASIVARLQIAVDQKMSKSFVGLEHLKVRHLRKLCRSMKLSSEGRKNDLFVRLEEYRARVSADKERRWLCDIAEITKDFTHLKTRLCLKSYEHCQLGRLLENLDKVPNLTSLDLQSSSTTPWFSKTGETEFTALANKLKCTASSLTALSMCGVTSSFFSDEASLNAAAAVHLSSCLKVIPLLRSLDLQFMVISDECAVILFDGLKHLARLNMLGLHGCRLTGAGAAHLAQALRHMPQLTSLSLVFYPREPAESGIVGPAGLRHIADGLLYNPKLTALYISGTRMGDEGAANLAAALRYVPKLACLSLNDNALSADGVGSIFVALQHTPLIASLHLSSVSGDGVALLLAAALHCVPLLTRLNMTSCNISDDGAEALARELPAVPRLGKLDLSCNLISQGAEALLAQATRLKALNLSKNLLGPSSMPAFSRGIVRATSLTSLRVCDNDFREGGALLLAEGLRASPLISYLDISGSRFPLGPGGADELCLVLRQLPSLSHLDAGGHCLGPDGVRAVAGELARVAQHLTYLSLSSNGAGDAGAEAIAAALPRWPLLSYLSLDDNDIGDAGATQIADALHFSKAMTLLFLDGNLFGEAGARRLLEAQLSARPQICYIDIG